LSAEPPPEGSEYVRWVQSSLNAILGLRLPLDGILGPETRSAIRSFQKKQGLPADGIVGPDTQQALSAARRAGTRPAPQEFEAGWGSQAQEVGRNRRSRAYVRWVQGSLNRILGLRLAVDGILGRQTRSAIRTFQGRFGLAVDGIVGPRTEAALKAALSGRSRPTRPAPPPRAPTAPAPSTSVPAPPTEGPYQGITGTRCPNGRGKCWHGARSRDIVDGDVPWNDETHRSPAAYNAVLDYFNVDHRQNPRYQPRNRSTYCNIYVHDVTRAMWASVPHWVRDARHRSGWNELSANRTYTWMLANARRIGWVRIDAKFCQWLVDQHNQAASLSFGDPSVPERILVAGSRVSAGHHPNPALLSQPSYVAQQFANLGLPACIIWKNPGGHGHMVMVRPEQSGLRGQVDPRTQIFMPRSAQAGRNNWRNELARWINSRARQGPSGAHFYVHA